MLPPALPEASVVAARHPATTPTNVALTTHARRRLKGPTAECRINPRSPLGRTPWSHCRYGDQERNGPTGTTGACWLEELRAPWLALGSEELVGPRDCARRQLLEPPGAHKLIEGEAPEVDGAERRYVESQLGRSAGALGAAVRDLPGSLVPRTELVAHLDDDRAVAQRPRGERGADVYEAHPERLDDGEAHPARLPQPEEERVVERQPVRVDARDPVDREQVAPDRRQRLRRGAERLPHLEGRPRDHVLRGEVEPVERVPLRPVVELDHDARLLAARGAPPLAQAPDAPPVGRAGEHADGLGLDAVVDAGQHLERLLLAVEQPGLAERLAVAQDGVLLRQLDVAGERGEAVAEARVDPAFRGEQHRERLASLVRVVELSPHQRAEHA